MDMKCAVIIMAVENSKKHDLIKLGWVNWC